MPDTKDLTSKHFNLGKLTGGVFACIHKKGGAAYSNAGIIDLGDRTIVVDAFDTKAAASDLRHIAETLFARPVDTIVLTHVHNDHWIGASAFEPDTTLLSTKAIREESLEWGKEMMKEFQNPEEWEKYVQEMEAQLQTETDERIRVGLERSIRQTHYTIAEMSDFQPRYADKTFEDQISFKGSERAVEVVDFGPGHSGDDVVVLIPQEKIAFIGDIGFFDQQAFMGYCDLDLWRAQIKRFMDSEFEIFVPGHGALGNKASLSQQLEYFDVMEELIGKVVKQGGSLEEAKQINLPEPFSGWLMGSMSRYEINVKYVYKRMGGEIAEEKE